MASCVRAKQSVQLRVCVIRHMELKRKGARSMWAVPKAECTVGIVPATITQVGLVWHWFAALFFICICAHQKTVERASVFSELEILGRSFLEMFLRFVKRTPLDPNLLYQTPASSSAQNPASGTAPSTNYRIEPVFRQKMSQTFQLFTMLLAAFRVNRDISCLQPISRTQHQRLV